MATEVVVTEVSTTLTMLTSLSNVVTENQLTWIISLNKNFLKVRLFISANCVYQTEIKSKLINFLYDFFLQILNMKKDLKKSGIRATHHGI